MKYFLAILIFFALIFGFELNKPSIESTESFNKIVTLNEGLKVHFINNYDYQYFISLKLKDVNYSKLFAISYKLTIDGKSDIVVDTFSLGNSFTNIGYFSSETGNKCIFEILDLSDEINTKRANLIIDVNGGGPSVGIAFAKEFRPLIQNLFIGIVILILIIIILLFVKSLNYKKLS